jgi:predicted site-specific integrase-resolvase
MPKLSPRDVVKLYQVSRATLMKALSDGTISAEKTDAGHWRIDPAELRRVYSPRLSQAAVGRTKPDQVSRSEPDQKADVGHPCQ